MRGRGGGAVKKFFLGQTHKKLAVLLNGRTTKASVSPAPPPPTLRYLFFFFRRKKKKINVFVFWPNPLGPFNPPPPPSLQLSGYYYFLKEEKIILTPLIGLTTKKKLCVFP